jgi:hypothetical protein
MSENLSSSEFLNFNYDEALIRKDSKEPESKKYKLKSIKKNLLLILFFK